MLVIILLNVSTSTSHPPMGTAVLGLVYATASSSYWRRLPLGDSVAHAAIGAWAAAGAGFCSCGDAVGSGPQFVRVADDECGGECEGEGALQPRRRCGGAWRNAVYTSELVDCSVSLRTVGVATKYASVFAHARTAGALPHQPDGHACNDPCRIGDLKVVVGRGRAEGPLQTYGPSQRISYHSILVIITY